MSILTADQSRISVRISGRGARLPPVESSQSVTYHPCSLPNRWRPLGISSPHHHVRKILVPSITRKNAARCARETTTSEDTNYVCKVPHKRCAPDHSQLKHRGKRLACRTHNTHTSAAICPLIRRISARAPTWVPETTAGPPLNPVTADDAADATKALVGAADAASIWITLSLAVQL